MLMNESGSPQVNIRDITQSVYTAKSYYVQSLGALKTSPQTAQPDPATSVLEDLARSQQQCPAQEVDGLTLSDHAYLFYFRFAVREAMREVLQFPYGSGTPVERLQQHREQVIAKVGGGENKKLVAALYDQAANYVTEGAYGSHAGNIDATRRLHNQRRVFEDQRDAVRYYDRAVENLEGMFKVHYDQTRGVYRSLEATEAIEMIKHLNGFIEDGGFPSSMQANALRLLSLYGTVAVVMRNLNLSDIPHSLSQDEALARAHLAIDILLLGNKRHIIEQTAPVYPQREQSPDFQRHIHTVIPNGIADIFSGRVTDEDLGYAMLLANESEDVVGNLFVAKTMHDLTGVMKTTESWLQIVEAARQCIAEPTSLLETCERSHLDHLCGLVDIVRGEMSDHVPLANYGPIADSFNDELKLDGDTRLPIKLVYITHEILIARKNQKSREAGFVLDTLSTINPSDADSVFGGDSDLELNLLFLDQ